MNDFYRYHIGDQIHDVYHAYNLGGNSLFHFTLKSKIYPYKRLSNSFYNYFISSQLRQIDKLRYRYKYLDEHISALQQILKKYNIIKRKIPYINNILHLHIRTPFVYDLDSPFQEKRSEHHYSCRLAYLLDKRHAIKVGSKGEKYTFNSNIFENDHLIRDVNIPDNYGHRGHSNQYMFANRLTNQMDIVIVNTRGVFILEVKNYKSPTFIIKSSGRIYITDRNGNDHVEGNVVDQNARHQAAMEEFFRDHGLYNVNVHSLIICANDDARVRSLVPNIHIYKPRTFYPAFINQQDISLSLGKVKFICQLLKKYSGSENEQKFPEPVFTRGFIREVQILFNYERAIFSLDKIAYRLASLRKHRRYYHSSHYYSSFKSKYPYRSRHHRHYPYNRYGHRIPWY